MKTQDLVAWLAQQPFGATTKEVLSAAGCRNNNGKRLRRLRRLGLILSVEAGNFLRWCTAQHAAHALAYVQKCCAISAEAAKERARLYSVQKTRQRRQREKLAREPRVAAARAAREADGLEINRRWWPANQAPPLRKRGPSSVWELAA